MSTHLKSSSRPASPGKKPTPPGPAKPAAHLRRGLTVVVLLAALAAACWSWRQYARPGAAHLQKGLDAAAAQQYPQAEQEWLAGIQEDPTFAPCHVQLGDLYMQERRYPEAAAQYNAATRLTPDDGMLFLKLNRADLAVKDIPGARAAAKRAAGLRPDDPDAVGLYGTLEGKYDDRPAALPALRRAHQLRPEDRDYFISMVMLEMNMQDMASAERDLTPWLAAHPQDAWAGHLMAVVDEQKPRTPATLQAAITLEEHARTAMPGDMRVYITLGELYLSANRPADALRIYQAGLRLDRNSEEMLHGLVNSDTRLGQTAQAAAAAQRLQTETTRHQRITRLGDLLGFHPDNVSLASEKAHLQEQDGNSQAAGVTYEQLVRHAPRDPRAHAALADFYARMGLKNRAQQARRLDFVP